MWGYRNARFEAFGKFAARVDDVLNIVPAQLTALIYLLCGRCNLSQIKSAFAQGWRWKSVAAGPVMAAGAYSLGLRLGGSAVYHGKASYRADLGEGAAAKAVDISRTRALLKNALYAWVLLSLVIMVLLHG
jgi:adenosylcobinamide-phosphate synthase